jgi:hypothetical protein
MRHFNLIMGALENHIYSLDLDIDFVFPNDKREPDENEEYIRINHLFGDTLQACLGDDGKDLTTGILQIDVVTPQNKGRSQILDDIANHFARGTIIRQSGVNLRIISASLGVSIYERNHFNQPVSIAWHVFTKSRAR